MIMMQTTLAAPTRDGVLAWLEEYRYAHDGPIAGTIVGVEDLELLRPFVVPGFFDDLQFPEVAVEIEAPYHFEAPATYQEATVKGGDRASLGADGALENYAAGLPFSHARIAAASPDDAGQMVAWNHIQRWQFYG